MRRALFFLQPYHSAARRIRRAAGLSALRGRHGDEGRLAFAQDAHRNRATRGIRLTQCTHGGFRIIGRGGADTHDHIAPAQTGFLGA